MNLKFIFLFNVFLFFSKIVFSQNPENIWWSSVKIKTSKVDSLTGKSETMGWSETKSGEFAFEFSETGVRRYNNGFMGEGYQSTDRFSVINRKMVIDTSYYAEYAYNVEDVNVRSVSFIVRVLKGNDEKAAYIFVYDNFDSKHKPTRIISYLCIKGFKK